MHACVCVLGEGVHAHACDPCECVPAMGAIQLILYLCLAPTQLLQFTHYFLISSVRVFWGELNISALLLRIEQYETLSNACCGFAHQVAFIEVLKLSYIYKLPWHSCTAESVAVVMILMAAIFLSFFLFLRYFSF